MGFVNVMTEARKVGVNKVIYASSSSLYNGNTKSPGSRPFPLHRARFMRLHSNRARILRPPISASMDLNLLECGSLASTGPTSAIRANMQIISPSSYGPHKQVRLWWSMVTACRRAISFMWTT